MKKMLLSGMFALIMALSLFAQNPDRKPIPSADKAKNTVDKISQTVAFSDKQKAEVTAIFATFFDDVHSQQAFRDPSKMESLEKTRDAKVEKLLNNPKLYKQYEEAIKKLNGEKQEHQHQQDKH